MSMADWIMLAAAMVALLLTGACALAETAFLRLNRVRALALAE